MGGRDDDHLLAGGRVGPHPAILSVLLMPHESEIYDCSCIMVKCLNPVRAGGGVERSE